MAEPESGDHRFKDPAWQESTLFDYIKQSYLLTARWLQSTSRQADGLDDKTARKVDFYTRQFVDAMAPTNFVATNPEVLRTTIESGGENLVKGLQNMLDDLERGKGRLMIKMTDMECLQGRQEPGGDAGQGRVPQRPDRIDPIRSRDGPGQTRAAADHAALDQQVLHSRSAPQEFLRQMGDRAGPHRLRHLLGQSRRASSRPRPSTTICSRGRWPRSTPSSRRPAKSEVNMIGYCLGGTLLAATLAYMAAKGDSRAKSATFFASMVDFKEAGELSVFIDEEQLASLEERMKKHGYLEGADMATTFNMLRANDLIWSFVVNNYLLGKEPFPFDLLYWNSDSTRMPAAMHSFYLRTMYQENKLVAAGRHHAWPACRSICARSRRRASSCRPRKTTSRRGNRPMPRPSFIPARSNSCWPPRATSPASSIRRANRNTAIGATTICRPARMIGSRAPSLMTGSWWPDWNEWVSQYSGGDVAARKPGDGKLKPLADAPGTYVMVRSGD